MTAERLGRICKYIAGIIRNHEGVPLAVGGVSDHLHIATVLSPTIELAKFIGMVKSNCSKWIHETFDARFSKPLPRIFIVTLANIVNY